MKEKGVFILIIKKKQRKNTGPFVREGSRKGGGNLGGRTSSSIT